MNKNISRILPKIHNNLVSLLKEDGECYDDFIFCLASAAACVVHPYCKYREHFSEYRKDVIQRFINQFNKAIEDLDEIEKTKET